jgi:membrane protease YdiL (CAAX protease family)
MIISPMAWTFLLLTTLFFPYAAIRSGLRVRQLTSMPTRLQYLISVAVSQGMLLATALLAANYDYVDLFPAPSLGWSNLAMAIGFLIPSVSTLPIRWRWKSTEEKQRMLWLLPNRTSDLGWWVPVALVAGTVEEIAYRGVMFQLWQRVLGSWWPAVLLCSVAFAVAHFIQGWRPMVLITIMTIGFHAIVLASGDLYTVMTIHFVYDLLAGIVLLQLAKRDGLVPASSARGG